MQGFGRLSDWPIIMLKWLGSLVLWLLVMDEALVYVERWLVFCILGRWSGVVLRLAWVDRPGKAEQRRVIRALDCYIQMNVL